VLYFLVLIGTWVLIWDFGNTPMWEKFGIFYDECSSTWWANLGFINNFIPQRSSKMIDGCMVWSIFIAIEM
jgi:hypothetical protein